MRTVELILRIKLDIEDELQFSLARGEISAFDHLESSIRGKMERVETISRGNRIVSRYPIGSIHSVKVDDINDQDL